MAATPILGINASDARRIDLAKRKIAYDKMVAEKQTKAQELKPQIDIANAQSKFRDAYKSILEYGVPYLVLFIVFAVILFALKKGSTPPRPTSRANLRKDLGYIGKLLKTIKNQFSFGPTFKKMARMVSFTGADTPSISRPGLDSGRSDNVIWVETDGEGNLVQEGEMGYSETTTIPDNIYWKMDISRMPEYSQLPEYIRKQIKNQTEIIIPWDQNSEQSFYVPQCEKAVFAKSCDPNDPTNLSKCAPADLFEDNGMSCRLKEQTSLSYTGGKRCNTSSDVGIINPKNVQILTLIKALQNKLDKSTTSDDIMTKYKSVSLSSLTNMNPAYNKDLPSIYSSEMNTAINSQDYQTGGEDTISRAYYLLKVKETLAKEQADADTAAALKSDIEKAIIDVNNSLSVFRAAKTAYENNKTQENDTAQQTAAQNAVDAQKRASDIMAANGIKWFIGSNYYKTRDGTVVTIQGDAPGAAATTDSATTGATTTQGAAGTTGATTTQGAATTTGAATTPAVK